jgi:rhamnogalacturonan endolyase
MRDQDVFRLEHADRGSEASADELVARPHRPSAFSRRLALQTVGGITAAAAVAGFAEPAAAAPASRQAKVLIGDQPATLGSYAFPADVPQLVLDNGLVRIVFGRDDAGVLTGWTDVSITATSVVVTGTELAHNLNGVDPRDPDRQHSFYVDAGGGKTRLVCTRVDVLRVERDLVEVAFVDTTSTPLQHEHHLIMRAGRRGL